MKQRKIVIKVAVAMAAAMGLLLGTAASTNVLTEAAETNTAVQDETASGHLGGPDGPDWTRDGNNFNLTGGVLTERIDNQLTSNIGTATVINITGKLYLEGEASRELFSSLNNVTTINGMENVDTAKATNMELMFAEDQALTSIDVSSFDTRKVTDMAAMFANDSSMKSINVANFNTDNVTIMPNMFADMHEVESINGTNFNTQKVTEMTAMFWNDPNLKTVDVSSFQTPNVTSFRAMFADDSSLTSLDLSGFDTQKLLGYSNGTLGLMLRGTSSLTQLTLGPNIQFDKNKTINGASAGLPTLGAPAGSERWQAVAADKGGTADNPKGATAFLPDELTSLYDQSNANHPTKVETWVPYFKDTLDVKSPINLTVGQSFDPKAGFVSAADGNGEPVTYDQAVAEGKPGGLAVDTSGLDTSKPGTYNVTYSYHMRKAIVKVIVSAVPGVTPNPTPPPNPNGNNSGNSNPVWNPTNPKNPNGTGLPNFANVKNDAVYATKKIYLYQNPTFKKSQRIAVYPKAKRINRPMFVVVDFAKSNGGALRIKVRDVNHGKKTAGKVGYITANPKYVTNVYYQTMPKSNQVKVIATKGVYVYQNANLSGKAKHYKKGARLTVKKLVKHNLTTRYQLSNGHFITGNKKLVIHSR